ncbi:flagellar biosynthetic protein FliQ [Xylanibacillus composti]|uniref:Flagellar biosynthetic protein FliQ n=1 Tax=Xylanibacillus composti TaxID=1572762 RepID=A0A8J4M208_9BACL|nr:flagellar biosynthesis protein FliQ [Xylanibacillus composti]GIQ68630.1 flagellar biosynthetic protein FliQ [Xylanibacillus composti]
MSTDEVIHLAGETVYVILKLSVPLMLVALIVGLLVSIFQATTQIQEQTLAFIPKILAVLVSVFIFGPWMVSTIVDFTENLFVNLYRFIG